MLALMGLKRRLMIVATRQRMMGPIVLCRGRMGRRHGVNTRRHHHREGEEAGQHEVKPTTHDPEISVFALPAKGQGAFTLMRGKACRLGRAGE